MNMNDYLKRLQQKEKAEIELLKLTAEKNKLKKDTDTLIQEHNMNIQLRYDRQGERIWNQKMDDLDRRMIEFDKKIDEYKKNKGIK